MWRCSKCGEEQEDTLSSCWKCGEKKPETADSPPEAKGTPHEPDRSAKAKPIKGVVLKHWFTLVPDFKASTQQFYSDIEVELKSRKVPDLETGRVEFSQGGILSGKREYLRMQRERLVFDICSAPFGTAHFFSCRFVGLESKITLSQILAIFLSLAVIFHLARVSSGTLYGSLITLGFVLFLILMMRSAVAFEIQSLDTQLMNSFLGPIYERFFRKETYFREDTRLMYMDTVDAVVKEKIEEVLGTHGIKLVRFNDRKSVLNELYTPRIAELPATESKKAA